MEAGTAQPFLPIAPAPWRLFGDFLAAQKVTRRRGGETPPFKIRRNQAFFPSSNAFLFSSKNFAGTIASRDFCQASWGRSK